MGFCFLYFFNNARLKKITRAVKWIKMFWTLDLMDTSNSSG
ncbi:MAG TPA: hypothetical protein VMC08_06895 [Bacteroidales bacterium]|nr:hypothetical protein [Bacteroidales bacterium]